MCTEPCQASDFSSLPDTSTHQSCILVLSHTLDISSWGRRASQCGPGCPGAGAAHRVVGAICQLSPLPQMQSLCRAISLGKETGCKLPAAGLLSCASVLCGPLLHPPLVGCQPELPTGLGKSKDIRPLTFPLFPQAQARWASPARIEMAKGSNNSDCVTSKRIYLACRGVPNPCSTVTRT